MGDPEVVGLRMVWALLFLTVGVEYMFGVTCESFL